MRGHQQRIESLLHLTIATFRLGGGSDGTVPLRVAMVMMTTTTTTTTIHHVDPGGSVAAALLFRVEPVRVGHHRK
jgi:hypothetical protein